MKRTSDDHARLRAARFILWGNLIFFCAGLFVQAIVAILVILYGSSLGYRVTWVYTVLLIGLAIAAFVALKLLDRSLFGAMQFFAWAGMLCVGGMIIYDAIVFGSKIPFVIFAFHMGIFSLGLTLGFKPALVYATATAAVLVITGLAYEDLTQVFSAMILAYGMTLPSWLIDRLERDLKQSEQKFSIVFREALDVILVLQSESGRILSANQAATTILQYSPDSLVDQPFRALLPEESPLAGESLYQMLHKRGPLFESQVFLRKDRSLCPMDLTATLIPWERGVASLITLRDITDRKRAEEELERYRTHLEILVEERTAELAETNLLLREEIVERRQAEAELLKRNDELDAYAHTVAHDLKNPLTTILGFSQLLSSRKKKLEAEKKDLYLSIITNKGHKMTRIIDELLLMASLRNEEVQVAPLNMTDVISEAQDRLVSLISEYDAKIEIVQPESWPLALGYAPWVEEIWANYISNAIKYGGTPPQVELGAHYKADNLVCFWVRDNGGGLSPEEQAGLFSMHARLQRVRAKGHGLGLSIVRRIVEKLGGEVGVESSLGLGSAFTFTLPAAQDVKASDVHSISHLVNSNKF